MIASAIRWWTLSWQSGQRSSKIGVKGISAVSFVIVSLVRASLSASAWISRMRAFKSSSIDIEGSVGCLFCFIVKGVF